MRRQKKKKLQTDSNLLQELTMGGTLNVKSSFASAFFLLSLLIDYFTNYEKSRSLLIYIYKCNNNSTGLRLD